MLFRTLPRLYLYSSYNSLFAISWTWV